MRLLGHLSLLPRQRGRPRRGRPHCCGRSGGALHPQEARCRLSRPQAIRYCLDAGKRRSRRHRPRRLFRKAAHQIRAADGDLSRQCAAWLPSFRMAIPVWIKEKLFQKPNLEKALKSLRAERQGRGQAAVRRAPPEPRGLRLLSLAIRGGGGADHGRRRRMGDDVGRHRPRQHA